MQWAWTDDGVLLDGPPMLLWTGEGEGIPIPPPTPGVADGIVRLLFEDFRVQD